MDMTYLLFLLPAIVLSGIATVYTQLSFRKYSKIRSASGFTGARAAQELLRARGVDDVSIEEVGGFLSDHYDPRSKTLRLSPGVYGSDSLAAIGVACHEAGHAIQHAENYKAMGLRTALVPVANIGTFASWILLPLGFILNSLNLVLLGIALFSAVVLFSFVTLPVEWNASARAKKWMTSAGIVAYDERAAAARVLNAAFLTYVAAAFMALMQLLYYLIRAGVLGGRRND